MSKWLTAWHWHRAQGQVTDELCGSRVRGLRLIGHYMPTKEKLVTETVDGKQISKRKQVDRNCKATLRSFISQEPEAKGPMAKIDFFKAHGVTHVLPVHDDFMANTPPIGIFCSFPSRRFRPDLRTLMSRRRRENASALTVTSEHAKKSANRQLEGWRGGGGWCVVECFLAGTSAESCLLEIPFVHWFQERSEAFPAKNRFSNRGWVGADGIPVIRLFYKRLPLCTQITGLKNDRR